MIIVVRPSFISQILLKGENSAQNPTLNRTKQEERNKTFNNVNRSGFRLPLVIDSYSLQDTLRLKKVLFPFSCFRHKTGTKPSCPGNLDLTLHEKVLPLFIFYRLDPTPPTQIHQSEIEF